MAQSCFFPVSLSDKYLTTHTPPHKMEKKQHRNQEGLSETSHCPGFFKLKENNIKNLLFHSAVSFQDPLFSVRLINNLNSPGNKNYNTFVNISKTSCCISLHPNELAYCMLSSIDNS